MNRLSQDVTFHVNDDADPSDGFVDGSFGLSVIPTCLAAFDYLSSDSLDDLVVGFENSFDARRRGHTPREQVRRLECGE